MTAEIGILNRNAVALAADSAVTLTLPEGPKIYLTNKLFTLSKYEPVGVMVYGSADFMRVPWETIIKAYRAQLGKRSFRHVQDYTNDFLNFIESNTKFFPLESQEVQCYDLVRTWLHRLKLRLRKAVEAALEKQSPISDDTVRSMFRNIVNEDLAYLKRHRKIPRFARTTPSALLRQYRGPIQQAIADELQKLASVFPSMPLERGCVLALMRDPYWSSDSGLVVAGFGTDQFLPSLRCYKMDTILGGRLRTVEEAGRRSDIGAGNTGAIVAFAQSEMVALFMNGVDPDYSNSIGVTAYRVFVDGYPALLDKLLEKDIKRGKRQRILKKIREAGEKAVSDLMTGAANYSREYHWEPIVEIVAHLPKEELAAMAEALVNLTSFKRHVTKQAETVGGPIDVAVISRGDGFVWIKRKHYFKAELNPHFFANYFYDTNRGKP
jgi:hypothetical protein